MNSPILLASSDSGFDHGTTNYSKSIEFFSSLFQSFYVFTHRKYCYTKINIFLNNGDREKKDPRTLPAKKNNEDNSILAERRKTSDKEYIYAPSKLINQYIKQKHGWRFKMSILFTYGYTSNDLYLFYEVHTR